MSSSPSSPGSLGSAATPHLSIVPVDLRPITTAVTFGGKIYTIKFTPPDPSVTGKGYNYTSDTIKHIEAVALNILQAQHDSQEKAKPGSFASTHTIQALFTEDSATGTTSLQVQTKTDKGSFEDSTIESSKLSAIATKVSAIYSSGLLTASVAPSAYHTVFTSDPKNTLEFLGRHFYKDDVRDNLIHLLTLKNAVATSGSLITLDTYNLKYPGLKTAVESLDDPEVKVSSSGDITINVDAVIAKLLSDSGTASSDAAPAPCPQSSLLIYLAQNARCGPIFLPHAENTEPTLKGIANPSCNCFMNAALTGFFSNETVYNKVMSILDAAKGSINNPTIEGLRTAPPAPLDSDYTTWDIGDGSSSDTSKLALNDTFLRMTTGNAAACAHTLLDKWKNGNALNSKESQLLRLSLIKLFGNTPTSFTPPHLIQVGPHAKGSSISIAPYEPEDSVGFISQLLGGLNKIQPGSFVTNDPIHPSKIFIAQAPITIIPGANNAFKINSAQVMADVFNKVTPLAEADRPNTLLFEIANPNPAMIPLPSLDVKIEGFNPLTSGYIPDSFTVYSSPNGSTSGHNWTYRLENGNFFRYDDYLNPNCYQVTHEEVVAVLRGHMKGTYVKTMTYKKI